MAVMRVTLKAKIFGQEHQNVMHFENDVGHPPDKGDLAIAIRDRMVSQLRLNVPNAFTFYQVHIVDIADSDDVPVILSMNEGGAHFAGTDVFLPQCVVLQIKTPLNTPKGRGRIYLGGQRSSDLVNGQYTPGRINQLQNMCNSILTSFSGVAGQSGWILGVHPRKSEGPDFKRIESLVVRPWPGVQVRRNFFRGA